MMEKDTTEKNTELLQSELKNAKNLSAFFEENAKNLKEKYGKDVIFWGGGYDAQLISANSTYEEVYVSVFKTVKALAENGNYIFSGVHNLPAEMSETHIKAMLDAFKDARAY